MSAKSMTEPCRSRVRITRAELSIPTKSGSTTSLYYLKKDIIDPELDDKLADLEKSVDNTVRILDNAYDKNWKSKEVLTNANKKFKIGIIFTSLDVVLLFGMLIYAIASDPYMFISLIIPAIGLISIVVMLFLNIKKRNTLPGEIQTRFKS